MCGSDELKDNIMRNGKFYVPVIEFCDVLCHLEEKHVYITSHQNHQKVTNELPCESPLLADPHRAPP